MKATWKKYLLNASLIIVGGGLIFLLVETIRAKNTGFETKTLWDWMELLVIPVVLAVGAFYLNRSERTVERQIAERRIKEDRQLAEDRANLEREIATDRQQEAALQAYFDRMADLLLEKKLLTTKDKEVRDVARIRTISVLQMLDENRKGLVIKFLYEAELISKSTPIVNLQGAYLVQAELYQTNLQDAYLVGVDLRQALLFDTNLAGANLARANLYRTNLLTSKLAGANLSLSNLQGANLLSANLKGAILRNAILLEANMRGAMLDGADMDGVLLKGATMPDGTIHE